MGEFTPPRWVDDGLAKPITGATPRYGDGRVVAVPEGIVEQLRGIGDAVYTGTDETACLLYTSPSPRDRSLSRMPSSA